MQELEKILEEIDLKITGSMGKRREGLLEAENIIRKHMNDNNSCGECSRRKWYQIGYKDGKDDGWIPVEERMPEDGTYLCTLKGELCGIEEPFTGMCGIENGIWDEPDCVIAWRPLPEPYRPEVGGVEKPNET